MTEYEESMLLLKATEIQILAIQAAHQLDHIYKSYPEGTVILGLQEDISVVEVCARLAAKYMIGK